MSNLIDEGSSFFVVGRDVGDKKYVMLTLIRTAVGWNQSSSARGYNREYVSNESMNALNEWFVCEFENVRVFEDRLEAMQFCERKTVKAAPSLSSEPFFFADAE